MTSWIRSPCSEHAYEEEMLSVGGSATAGFGQAIATANVGGKRLVRAQSTAVDVSSKLLGEGWQVLWERERQFVEGDDVPERGTTAEVDRQR